MIEEDSISSFSDPLYKTKYERIVIPDIKDFDIKDWCKRFKPNGRFNQLTMVVCGPPASGKSVFVKDLWNLGLKNNYDLVFIFSNTVNEGAYNYMNSETTKGSSQFHEELIEKIIKYQDKALANHKKLFNILIVMDDCSDKKVKKSEMLEKILKMGRHWGISCIYVIQDIYNCPKEARNEITHLVLFEQNGVGRISDLIDWYFSKYTRDEITGDVSEKLWWKKFIKTYNDDYQALILVQGRFKRGKIDFFDRIFKYKVNIDKYPEEKH